MKEIKMTKAMKGEIFDNKLSLYNHVDDQGATKGANNKNTAAQKPKKKKEGVSCLPKQ